MLMKALLTQITKVLVILICFFCQPTITQATHIVGGELTYTCLGNDQYEIELTIFRDCWNGNPAAYFDDPAAIGIYDGNGLLIDSLMIPFDQMLDDTLDPILANPCLVVPPNVCVHTTKYSGITTLPPAIGGYELIYQRCCRNVTINNIVDPLGSGATFGVTISEQALLECNSSAKFNAWPPIYICVDEPIDFDQSAIDPDGDSIVYRLCTPLLGATPGEPQPVPSNQTVPSPVVWVDPPYNEANMLNGTLGGTVLEIDEQTGFLTGIPNTTGQFVVGICVEEYRNGSLISTTRRDFQFNVGICGQTISSFFAPEIICDEELTVYTNNLSNNADEFEWHWNDPANPGAVSFDVSPSYTYADTGAYTIMLIAEPGNPCVDTFYLDVYLQFESLFADFNYEFVECSDSMVIEAVDLSIDTISNPNGWVWELLDALGNVISTSTDQNPTFSVYETQDVTLQLIVFAENGCADTLQQAFFVDLLSEDLLADSVFICIGDSIQINPNPNPDYIYNWDPSIGLDDPGNGNPWASPTETTTYSVLITDLDSLCQIERSIVVSVPPPIVMDLPNDTTICDPDFELSVFSAQATQYFWANDAAINDVFSMEQTTVVTPIGTNTYYIQVNDMFNCPRVDSVTVTGLGINVDGPDIQIICDEETALAYLDVTDLGDTLTYHWMPDSLITIGTFQDTAIVAPPGPGTYTVYVELENQHGCTLIDSLQVGVIDTMPQAQFASNQQCSGYSVQFTNTSINAPFQVWNFGDPTNPTAGSLLQNPEYEYPGPGIYNVTLSVFADVNCPDTIMQQVVVTEPQITVDFMWDFESCSDSVVIQFTDLSTNLQSQIIGWEWMLSNGDSFDIQNPTVVINESQILEVTLTILSDDGCNDSYTQEIPIVLIEVALQDTLLSCIGDQTPLNPGGNSSYNYQWSPATGLNNPSDPNPLANPDVTTTYSVTVTDFTMDTCEVFQDITVLVPPPIELAVSNDTTICDTDIVIMAESPQAVSYTWSLDPSFSTTLSEDPEVLVEPGTPTTYYVQVEDEFGCTMESSVTVFNYQITATVPDYTICIGDSVELEVAIFDVDQTLTFDWMPNTNIIDGQQTPSPLVNPQSTTIYSTVVTNQFGCSATLDSEVSVFDFVPPLDLTADPDTIILGQSSQLTAVTDNSMYDFEWVPIETLSDPSIFNPVATPMETTEYMVSILNGDGCANTATVRVVVLVPICDDPFIFFPNAFTPNGDGENDVLQVYGTAIDEVRWVIYNRWGQKMYEANSADDYWDGTYDGKELAPDVFGYYLEVRCLGGEEFFKKGNVTILK